MLIALTGATGFVGRALVPALAERHSVVALGRRVSEATEAAATTPGLVWRRCDLFSLRETESALDGVEGAVDALGPDTLFILRPGPSWCPGRLSQPG